MTEDCRYSFDNNEENTMINNESNQRPKILTIQEVAKILRVHRSTVTRFAQSGQLRSHLIGNRRLFKEKDVWSFFDNLAA
jgi:excisionase family DNA binding protein